MVAFSSLSSLVLFCSVCFWLLKSDDCPCFYSVLRNSSRCFLGRWRSSIIIFRFLVSVCFFVLHDCEDEGVAKTPIHTLPLIYNFTRWISLVALSHLIAFSSCCLLHPIMVRVSACNRSDVVTLLNFYRIIVVEWRLHECAWSLFIQPGHVTNGWSALFISECDVAITGQKVWRNGYFCFMLVIVAS